MAELPKSKPEVINGKLRMAGDRILLKPLEWEGTDVHGEGSVLHVVRSGRPLRGRVIEVGPGIHPVSKRVKSDDGRKQRIEFSKRFRPTEVKVGDIVELGGLNIYDGKGYNFPEVIYNGERCLIVTERDVAIVRDVDVIDEAGRPCRISVVGPINNWP